MSSTDFVLEFCIEFDPMVYLLYSNMEQFCCDMCMTYKIVVKLGYQLPSHSLCELMAGCFCPKKILSKDFYEAIFVLNQPNLIRVKSTFSSGK